MIISPYIDDKKEITGLSINIIDVNDLEVSKNLIKDSETLVDVAAKYARVGIWVWNVVEEDVRWNDGMYDLFGVKREEFFPKYDYVVSRIVKEDRKKLEIAVKNTIEKREPFNIVYKIIKEDNQQAYIHAIGQFEKSKNGDSDTIAGMCFDVTIQKEAEQQLKEIAYRDPLTGIANRMCFIEELNKTINQAHKNSKFIAVLYIDLDKFKHINDIHGHLVGDQLLIEVINRLSKVINENDILARLGGDEFAAIITSCNHDGNIAQLAENCIKEVIKPYQINNEIISQSISIGIATYPKSSREANKLIQFADAAMYNSKQKGRNTYSFYLPEYSVGLHRLGEIENALKLALEREEFSLVYQPLYDSREELYGVEALLRWNSKDLGSVTPDEFIPIAEKSHEIINIGWWVIGQVIRDINYIEEIVCSKLDFNISINISSVQLFKEKFTDEILKLLSDNSIDSSSITFEITETHLLEDIDKAKNILTNINNAGVNFAIDDFGTGYSSLTYLANLPVKYLKIDKSFVQKLDEANNRAIVKAIIQLSHNLSRECVAEGVETLNQLDKLKYMDCDLYQGYHFNRPLPLNEIVDILKIKKQTKENLRV